MSNEALESVKSLLSFKRVCLVPLSLAILLTILPRQGLGGMVPYEAGTLTTIEGKIISVSTVDNRMTSELGFHLKVATADSGEYIVHVSPQWYADKQRFEFMIGELLTVTGSAFTKDQQKNIYAATISRRFSSLPSEQQLLLASEILSPGADSQALAKKYAISVDEVERVKARVKQYITQALFPEPIQLRDAKTGEPLWGGRFFEQNMPLIRQQRQQEMRKMLKERKRP
ncbi:MAG: hypothetical protein K6U11_00390 [bacterium]|nr:hypothetical protein [bacterium]